MTFSDRLLDLAIEAVKAGEGVVARLFRSEELNVRVKTTGADLVTNADVAAENAIRNVILAARPEDAVVGEELGEFGGAGDVKWFLDPIDSTANFARGIPIWSISLAAVSNDGPLAAIVSHPVADERFTCSRDTLPESDFSGGARSLESAMVVVGWGNSSDGERESSVARELSSSVGKIRSPGSPALGLAWTAAGRFDAAFYEMGFGEWDIAAGRFLCERAGLMSRLDPPSDDAEFPRLLVAREAIFANLEQMLF